MNKLELLRNYIEKDFADFSKYETPNCEITKKILANKIKTYLQELYNTISHSEYEVIVNSMDDLNTVGISINPLNKEAFDEMCEICDMSEFYWDYKENKMKTK